MLTVKSKDCRAWAQVAQVDRTASRGQGRKAASRCVFLRYDGCEQLALVSVNPRSLVAYSSPVSGDDPAWTTAIESWRFLKTVKNLADVGLDHRNCVITRNSGTFPVWQVGPEGRRFTFKRGHARIRLPLVSSVIMPNLPRPDEKGSMSFEIGIEELFDQCRFLQARVKMDLESRTQAVTFFKNGTSMARDRVVQLINRGTEPLPFDIHLEQTVWPR